MMKLHYNRLEYTEMDKASGVVFRELAKLGIEKSEISDLAWYKFGRFAKWPLIVFLKNGQIFKIRTRKGSIYIDRIK